MSPIEKSMFIIKPEALPFKERIMSMVEKAGIPILEWRSVKITEEHLKGLYPGINGENLEKTKDYLLDKEVLAVVVETEDAVEKLYRLCGENTKSFLCGEDTIRFSFKNIVSVNEKYNKNIVHRPINKDEAEKHLVLFFPKRD